jgi:hypothetical protein
MIGPSDTPQALRAALEARLRNVARQQGTDLQRLQRRVTFKRLFARLVAGDDAPWLLKGGYALELRLQDRARSTLDLDLSVPDPKRLVRWALGDEAGRLDTQIHEQLQIAAERDPGDGFQFLAWLLERTSMPSGGIHSTVEARLAVRAQADSTNGPLRKRQQLRVMAQAFMVTEPPLSL